MIELYSGKAKTLYSTSDSNVLLMRFRDDITAFDGAQKDTLPGKAITNNSINAFIMQHLANKGINTHFIRKLNDTDSSVYKLVMLPVECVVRNVCSGSMSKRYGIKNGTPLRAPVFEFFLKNDALHDPLCNEDHIRILGWAGNWETKMMRSISLEVNSVLQPLFRNAGFNLIDFKLEFGHNSFGELAIGDEITPDGCRIWDIDTNESYDKDRYRKNLGQVVEHYIKIANRLVP